MLLRGCENTAITGVAAAVRLRVLLGLRLRRFEVRDNDREHLGGVIA
jgi:hypothetical protein